MDPVQLIIGVSVLLLSLTVHEAAHAWSADRLGDATARRLGRLSLNPAVHIDPIGTILFPLIAILTGLPIIGWAKPVPVSVAQLRGNWRRKYMLIAAAGPASNLVLAATAAVGVRLMGFEAAGDALFRFLLLMVVINVLLAVFNMLPVPPLDGGNVLSGLLGGRAADLIDSIRPYGFLILYGLLLTGVFERVVFPIQEGIVGWLL
ncbi:MAG: site-2 protease family protein [Acidobacteria bacterium]|nr:site-2 protease family protein [Acidobacteriota bacterium]